MGFVNTTYPDCHDKDIKYICIAGLGCKINPNDWWKVGTNQWFAKLSYEMTAGKGFVEGDGIVPVEAATLRGATNLAIEGVWHSPTSPGPWYGTPQVVNYWAPKFLA